MSLQVWLPLNGNFNNNGVSSTVVTTSSTPGFVSGGKLGQAVNLTGNAQKILLSNYMNECKNYTTYSMTAWAYLDSTSANHSSAILSSGNWNATANQLCFGFYNYDGGYTKILVPNVEGWSAGLTLTTPIQLSAWYHVAITYDGSVTRVYVDGQYQGLYNGGGITQTPGDSNLRVGGATYYDGFTMRGKLNDVRIYDNCLSESEIKDITKGLTLHYPLSSIVGTKIYDGSGYSYNGTIAGTLTTSTGSARYNNCTVFNGSSRISTSIQNSTVKAVSVWVYTTSIPSANQIIFQDQASSTGLGFYSGTYFIASAGSKSRPMWKLTDYKINQWNHIVVNFDDNNPSCYINGAAAVSNGTNYWSNPNGLTIGGRSSGNSCFNGKLSDFRLYTTLLTTTDIQDLYNAPIKVAKSGALITNGEIIES